MFKRLENPYEALKIGSHSSDEALLKSKISNISNIRIIDNRVKWTMPFPLWLKQITSKEDILIGCKASYNKDNKKLMIYSPKDSWVCKDQTIELDEAIDIINNNDRTFWKKIETEYWSNDIWKCEVYTGIEEESKYVPKKGVTLANSKFKIKQQLRYSNNSYSNKYKKY